LKCLSRVRLKSQARFLGEGDGSNAIPLPGVEPSAVFFEPLAIAVGDRLQISPALKTRCESFGDETRQP
jgi:hypothetical protein